MKTEAVAVQTQAYCDYSKSVHENLPTLGGLFFYCKARYIYRKKFLHSLEDAISTYLHDTKTVKKHYFILLQLLKFPSKSTIHVDCLLR